MEKLLKIDEVAEKLGLTVTAVYQAVYHKRMPAVKISKKCLRFDPSEIKKWLESKKRQAIEVEPKTPIRKSPGRPRKNGGVSNSYVNSIVEKAKKDVGV